MNNATLNEERQTLDANEAAAILRINPRTLKKLAREGKVPHIQIAGKYRFPVDILDQLAAGHPALKKLEKHQRDLEKSAHKE